MGIDISALKELKGYLEWKKRSWAPESEDLRFKLEFHPLFAV